MENQKTEFVDINDLLKEAGIRQDAPEKEEEVDTEGLLQKLTNEAPTIEKVEEVKKVEEVITPPVEEIKKEPVKKDTDYSTRLQEYIELGFIEDSQITYGEGDEAKEVFLSELQDLDKDTFQAIVSKYKEAKDKELKEKYISVDGLDERTKKYVELKKAGGDISTLIEQEVQYVNPLNSYDLEEESHQEHLVRVSLAQQGLKPKFIEQEIAELKENFTLDVEAKKIAQIINKQFDDHVEAKKQEQLDAIEKDRQKDKEFKKVISQSLKELVPNENIAKVLIENSTKKDEYGLTNTDKLYFDAQKNPEFFAQLTLFLNNQDEFYKNIGAKTKNKALKDVTKTLFTINPSVVKSVKTQKQPDTKGDEIFEKLTQQFKQ